LDQCLAAEEIMQTEGDLHDDIGDAMVIGLRHRDPHND
jgi:hypothetical protein